MQSGSTPLYQAAEKGHTDSIQELVKGGADVNKAREVGAVAEPPIFHPLHSALFVHFSSYGSVSPDRHRSPHPAWLTTAAATPPTRVAGAAGVAAQLKN